MGIFKACDVRGVYGKDLNEKEAYNIGRAVGSLNVGRTVVVAGDVRVSTPVLKSSLADGLMKSGASVVDLGIVPTPVFYHARHRFDEPAGVIVTASHNPPEFNGFKITLGKMPVTEEELAVVKRLSQNEDTIPRADGSVESYSPLPDYRRFILDAAKTLLSGTKHLKVVVDCGNGSFSGIAPGLLREAGLDVIELFCEPDGRFPNRPANSAVASNLKALRKRVVEESADFGIAYDGDGDRVSFVDEKGRFITTDKTIVIFANELVENAGDKVVYDIKCSRIVPEAVTAKGGTPLMERSGHTFIKTRMISENAVLGGEISGHIFYRELGGGDDGLYSSLVMAKIAGSHEGPLSVLVDSIPTYPITPDIRVPFRHDEAVLNAIAESFPDERVSRIDGVRVDFGNGWGLARLSVTEPVITLRFEAHTEERLHEIMREFTDPVPELQERVLADLKTL